MLMDILMEALMSMDDESLDYVLESCDAEELEIISDAMEASIGRDAKKAFIAGGFTANATAKSLAAAQSGDRSEAARFRNKALSVPKNLSEGDNTRLYMEGRKSFYRHAGAGGLDTDNGKIGVKNESQQAKAGAVAGALYKRAEDARRAGNAARAEKYRRWANSAQDKYNASGNSKAYATGKEYGYSRMGGQV